MDRYQIFIERHVRKKTYICILILPPILLSFYDNHFMIIQTKVVSLHPYCDVRSYK